MPDYTYEWLCREIVDGAPDGVIFSDKDGLIRLWNRGAELIFGYSAEEALGNTLDIIIPERFRQRHQDGYSKVMQTGVTKYATDLLAVPAIRKDGSLISIEFSVVLVFPDGGVPSPGPIGSAAIIRDVSTRWQKERAMKARLAELEARARSD